jgi:hypothetical protein
VCGANDRTSPKQSAQRRRRRSTCVAAALAVSVVLANGLWRPRPLAAADQSSPVQVPGSPAEADPAPDAIDSRIRAAHAWLGSDDDVALPVAAGTVPAAPDGFTFRNHVLPVLTKSGCNSGACHGAAAGKNGLALSLRGYDPDADYDALVRQASGRRVNRLEPARSLALLKPTEVVPHLGGRRLEPGDPEYDVIARWIAAGAPPPKPGDPTLDRLDVAAPPATLDIASTHRLVVRAHYSDGSNEDVTRWARYTTGDQSVATVDDYGLVTMVGPGETAIAVGYQSGVGLVQVMAPYPSTLAPHVFSGAVRVNAIDDAIVEKLAALRVEPSGLVGDAAFMRRAYLDAAGILPAPDEVERFVADRSPDKRAALVDALLAREEFTDYWAYKWSDLLLVSSRRLGPNNVREFYGWIRESVARNVPWDRFVAELTTATGRTTDHGAAAYFVIHRNPIDLAENYTQAFLGLTLTCARCHNHPMEKWTQRDYYGFANLFARVSIKTDTSPGGKDDTRAVFSTPAGDLPHPRTGEVLPPRPLDAQPMPAHDQGDRRAYLAAWVASPDNPLFVRTFVNRVWAHFMGRGLVEPVDDLRATNPVSNAALFDVLTDHAVATGFDVRALARFIMTSAAYQRSSETTPHNAHDDRYYSHYLPRRLPAEVVLDAVSAVTDVPERFAGYPAGTRALQLPDTRVSSYFLDVFGRPARLVTSVEERAQDPSLAQALHAINGSTLNDKLRAPDGLVADLMAQAASLDTALDTLYMRAFARRPSPTERTRLAGGVGDPARLSRDDIEDLAWAVLTSKEFLFNH